MLHGLVCRGISVWREGGVYIPQTEILKSVISSFEPEQKKYTHTILSSAGLMLDLKTLDVIFNLNHFMIPLPSTVLQGTK